MKGAGLLLLAAAALAAGCRAAERGPPIALPGADDPDTVFMREFTVNASHADWKYLAYSGYEILSRCSDEDTLWYASSLFRSRPLEEEILPEGYLPSSPVPMTAILYNRGPERANSPATLVPNPVYASRDDPTRWGPYRLMALHGVLAVEDEYSIGFCVNLWDPGRFHPRDGSIYIVDGGLLSFRLKQRAPLPPLWLQTGILDPYGLSRLAPASRAVVLPVAPWVSPAQAEADLAESRAAAEQAGDRAALTPPAGVVSLQPYEVRDQAKVVLLPLNEIFRERRPGEGPPSQLWSVEAALFVRWAYVESVDHPELAEAFRKFVERAGGGPVNEAVFQECFGIGYGAMETRLAAFLTWSMKEPIRVPYRRLGAWPTALPHLEPRPATEVEIARIVGDWERRRGGALMFSEPDTGRRYLHGAGELLHRAYVSGSRDPRLLAVLGLYENDIGNVPRARALLESVTGAHVVLPDAYLELAQIRYTDAKLRPEAPGNRFSARQITDILDPIFFLRSQVTLPAIVYKLIADILSRGLVKPTAANLAVLDEGLHFYPRSVSLAHAAASLSTQWGYNAQLDALPP